MVIIKRDWNVHLGHDAMNSVIGKYDIGKYGIGHSREYLLCKHYELFVTMLLIHASGIGEDI